MVRVLSGVEANPHRQSLHNLDVVAGGVFGGQQAVEFAGRSRHAFDVALVVATGRIDVNRNRLAATHSAQLRLAKISSNPDVDPDNREQLSSGLQTLTELNGLVADDSSGGRDYVRITQVEPRLIQRGLCRLHRGLVLANR